MPQNLSRSVGSDFGETHHIHIVNSIRQMIRDGVLQEGDPLPSERELAEKFNVSRVPIREAIKILEFIGVLRRVRSRGLFVNHVDVRQTMNQFQFIFSNTPEALEELMEFRQALEVQCAMLAAERRTEEDLLHIEEAWALCEHFIKMGRDPVKPSMELHFAIARATHNSVMMRTFDFMVDLHLFSARTNLHNSERQVKAHLEHRQIFESIRDRDPESAGLLMRQHMENSRRMAHVLALDGDVLAEVPGMDDGSDMEAHMPSGI